MKLQRNHPKREQKCQFSQKFLAASRQVSAVADEPRDAVCRAHSVVNKGGRLV